MEDIANTVIHVFGIKKPPVPVFNIVEKLGIFVVTAEFQSVAGVFVGIGNNTFIILKEDDPIPRKRFTLAHELGHILLNHPDPKYCSSHSKKLIEKQADYFAANLLVPKEWFKKDILNTSPTPDMIKRLARSYNVSKQVIERRIKEVIITKGNIEP